ncbi:MAG: iron donor protein CyaY [bacterium]|nr:iron donor protein CyaY [Planctomycetota bacterium]HIL51887.1 iron donor protein CyaY [Planctomycetota bacterium]
MDDTTFLKLADACLERIATWLEDFDPDELDFTPSDGVITLEFADGKRFVLNRQTAASQMWFAAGARAWHFDWDAQAKTWVGDKVGVELCACIAEAVTEKLGREVRMA